MRRRLVPPPPPTKRSASFWGHVKSFLSTVVKPRLDSSSTRPIGGRARPRGRVHVHGGGEAPVPFADISGGRLICPLPLGVKAAAQPAQLSPNKSNNKHINKSRAVNRARAHVHASPLCRWAGGVGGVGGPSRSDVAQKGLEKKKRGISCSTCCFLGAAIKRR